MRDAPVPRRRVLRLLRALVLAVAILLLWQRLLAHSVRADREALRRAVREYCRHELGQPRSAPSVAAMAEAFEGCDDFDVASVEVAGGLSDPVIVRIAIGRGPRFPLDREVVALRDVAIGFPVVSALFGLASGRWHWNPFVAYSDLTFRGSF